MKGLLPIACQRNHDTTTLAHPRIVISQTALEMRLIPQQNRGGRQDPRLKGPATDRFLPPQEESVVTWPPSAADIDVDS